MARRISRASTSSAISIFRKRRSPRSACSSGCCPTRNFSNDPLDFYRWVFGISYQYNEYLRFAIDSQNLSYYHSQQSIPISVLKPFGYAPGGTFNGQTLPKTGSIPDMVQRDTHSIFANVEFSY